MVKLYLIMGGVGFIGFMFIKFMLKEMDVCIIVLDKLMYVSYLEEMEKLKENS